MLHEWLAPVPVQQFVHDNLGVAPYARPSAATRAVPMFDFGVLDSVLRSLPAPDVLVARAGRLLNMSPPRSESEARQLMSQGLGIVVRRAERHDKSLAELAQAFNDDLPGEVHVQLYATPASTETFGWHYDDEDVFIAQTKGVKDYYFRANSVLRTQSAAEADFSRVCEEKSPLFTSRLISGDWLYIPARWWHLVRSVEDALSISIGVVPSYSRSAWPVPGSGHGAIFRRDVAHSQTRHSEAICPAPYRARHRAVTVSRRRRRA